MRYWSNPPFLIFDIRAPERQSARMSKIKNGGLDQYGAEPVEHQQFGTAGVEWVKWPKLQQALQQFCKKFHQVDTNNYIKLL